MVEAKKPLVKLCEKLEAKLETFTALGQDYMAFIKGLFPDTGSNAQIVQAGLVSCSTSFFSTEDYAKLCKFLQVYMLTKQTTGISLENFLRQ